MPGIAPGLRRWLRRAAAALLMLMLLILGTFGLMQTSVGREWLSTIAARAVSGPGFSIAIVGLEGTIPFDMRAERIEIADDHGAWLTIRQAQIKLSPADLLTGRIHVEALTAAAIEVARSPAAGTPAPSTTPLSEWLRLPHLPLGLAVDRLAVERLSLAAGVLGEPLEATLAGAVTMQDDATHATLDLRRTDGEQGNIDLDVRLAGRTPALSVRLSADEPTGLLLGRLLNRGDRPPLALSFTGEGPLSQWRGRLTASGGSLVQLECDVVLAGSHETVVTIDGIMAAAPLLPPGFAAVIGAKVPLHLRAAFAESGLLTLDEFSAGLAAGSITGEGVIGGPEKRLSALVQADFPDLSAPTGFAGPSRGSAKVTATLSGTEARPLLRIDALGDTLRLGASGAKHAEAHMTVGVGDTDQPAPQLEIAARGRVEGMIVPVDLAVPVELGRDLDWSFAARAASNGDIVELTHLTVQGIGLDIGGSGRFGTGFEVHDGRLHLSVADLRPFAPAFGLPIEGAVTFDATQAEPPGDTLSATFNGSLARLRTGVAAIDGLTGGSVTMSGLVRQNAVRAWVLDRLVISGANTSLSGGGEFDPATRQLTVTAGAEIPSLRPLGMAGRVAARVNMEGALDHPKVTAQLTGGDLRVGSARIDELQLDAHLIDLWEAKGTVDGKFRSGDLSGTLALEADGADPTEFVIPRLRVQAADGSAEGSFRIDRSTLLARGKLNARVPTLARWSVLAGLPLGGSVELKAELEKGSGQNIDLTASADSLSFGAGSHPGLGHLALSWHLIDAMGDPTGKAQVKLTALALGSGRLDEATLSLTSLRPGRFAFTADTKGRFVDPLAFTSRGEFEWASRKSEMNLRIVSLAGSIGVDRVQLTSPLALFQRGDELSLSNLALTLGSGQIDGNFALRSRALSGRIAAKNLPVALAARLAGSKASGTVTLDASVGGTTSAPIGHFTLSGRGLSFAHAGQRIPSLGLDAAGDWNGRELALKGKLAGLKGESLGFTGSLPLVLTVTPVSLAIPPAGRLTMRLEGNGDLANVADLLPIGEDRVSGRFTLDAGVTGTLAAPAASGRLTIAGGRYESFATGAVLKNLQVDLVGDRDRFTLRDLTASDSAGGSLTARGSVALGGSAGPAIEFTAKLAGFRITARDEAVVTASGTVAVKGVIAAPKISGELIVDHADCTIPDSLPPSVTRLKVIEINGGALGISRTPPSRKEQTGFAAPLDIQVTVPGQTFVRGHGLDSEWRGQLKVGGTSAAPSITGSLESVRGTFDILGKTFRVAHGVIAFNGGATFDPRLDIAAEVAAADITAQALVGGIASTPTVTLSSTPAVPQDEILARVLFGRGLGQISAGEGLQVATAAASLAGGGPGVLDKLRGGLGLDRLSFGAAANGPASSNLNPAAGGSATGSSPAVSGGKYVTKGVYVGATQGLTPSENKVTVEVDVYPHVTIETDRSQSGGTGIGLNYKYDY